MTRGPGGPARCEAARCFPTQAALDDASKGGRKAEAATWRRRMHRYLDALFRLDPATAEDFHHYQARRAVPSAVPASRRWSHCPENGPDFFRADILRMSRSTAALRHSLMCIER